MAKQRLEGYFSSSLRSSTIKDLWFIKLQVNQLAHKDSPADYIVLTKNQYLVECKECNAKGKLGRFDFDRLTQFYDLTAFDRTNYRNAYLCLMYWKGTLKKSDIYMIPIKKWEWFVEKWHKKSLNDKEAHTIFIDDKVSIYKRSLELYKYFN